MPGLSYFKYDILSRYHYNRMDMHKYKLKHAVKPYSGRKFWNLVICIVNNMYFITRFLCVRVMIVVRQVITYRVITLYVEIA